MSNEEKNIAAGNYIESNQSTATGNGVNPFLESLGNSMINITGGGNVAVIPLPNTTIKAVGTTSGAHGDFTVTNYVYPYNGDAFTAQCALMTADGFYWGMGPLNELGNGTIELFNTPTTFQLIGGPSFSGVFMTDQGTSSTGLYLIKYQNAGTVLSYGKMNRTIFDFSIVG